MEKRVYILLSDTGTIFTRLIKLYTKKPYNHASIAFDQNLLEVYSFGRINPYNPFKGGFVKEDLQGDLFKQARCSIYCCTVTDAQIEKMNHYIHRIEAQAEIYRYNLIGLFAVALNKPFNRRNAFFCSQFVATVLLESNVIKFDKPLSLITPHDLQASPRFELIFQGKLSDFYTEVHPKMIHAI
ncbi:hypothetical protein MUB24_11195 [Lederbergia sp. NSJ-179]|uniref:hypothetical protein n=1 Tax=Lederbergia sp. NSJ-179 TaxID=2931402 RepID=UPI001FD605B8|nr:hypothetical protein [Lederbergia sp. NSJ-179]MCJ7841450.1 hypothetical protein [Lederbergia sp. NSJ-179]